MTRKYITIFRVSHPIYLLLTGAGINGRVMFIHQ